jgi:hypothetical protein
VRRETEVVIAKATARLNNSICCFAQYFSERNDSVSWLVFARAALIADASGTYVSWMYSGFVRAAHPTNSASDA